MKRWKLVKSENILDAGWVSVRRDSVCLPNGQSIDDFYLVGIKNAAAVVAIDTKGNVILKNEYRYCYDRELIEIPAGVFEENETDSLTVAKRELLEETGYISEDWVYLGATIESSAKLTNYIHIYFARDCRKVAEQSLDSTEEMEVMAIPFGEAVDMVMSNQICCNSSARGILMAAIMTEK